MEIRKEEGDDLRDSYGLRIFRSWRFLGISHWGLDQWLWTELMWCEMG